MKGGETLHFRHFIITGLMACAAVFLPNHTFAEKNDISGQQISQNAAVQANASVKTDHTDVQTGKNVVVPEHGAAAKRGLDAAPEVTAKPRGAANPVNTSPAASKKPIAVPQNSVEQAKGNGLSAVRRAEKAADEAPGLKKVETVPEAATIKNEPNPKSKTENSALQAFHHPEIEVDNKAQSVRLVQKDEPQQEISNVTISRKNERIESSIPEPLNKTKLPVSKENLPADNQVMNPTQRTISSGGDSNDRVNHGPSTINWIDLWFKWDRYIQIKLVHPYHSRNALINNQWTNAPPSPPPQEAPFLEM